MEAAARLVLRLQFLVTSLIRMNTGEELLKHTVSEVCNAVGQRDREAMPHFARKAREGKH